MTKQETFDIVARGLLSQGCQSYDVDEDRCCYRLDMGDGTVLKCAAGMLIPDSKYSSEFENVGLAENLLGDIDPLSEKRTRIRNIILEEGHDIELVRQLQIVHDSYEGTFRENKDLKKSESFNEYLIREFHYIASIHGLSTDVLKE